MTPIAIANHPIPERINERWLMARVRIQESGCWEWKLARTKKGYGTGGWTEPDGHTTTMLAHRVAYRIMVGPIPEGLVIDHLCLNKPCCNPAHLEPVTVRVNNVRALRPYLRKVAA